MRTFHRESDLGRTRCAPMDVPPHNLRPRYNVCPTDPIDVVTGEDGKRELARCAGD